MSDVISTPADRQVPDDAGRFGPFGGRFVPETLTRALDELQVEYELARKDPEFQAELNGLLATYVGRPSPLYFAQRLTEHCGGAQIWLKREDLNHTGAHKINNTLGQALLTLRMGKQRVIAETGTGTTDSMESYRKLDDLLQLRDELGMTKEQIAEAVIEDE